MQTIRSRILDILKQQGQATVGELAGRLKMAPVSVRYHLDVLQGDGLIAAAKLQRAGTVGRPKQVYSLTEEAHAQFPHNFAPLTAGVVRQMKQLLPPEKVESAFRSLAEEMPQPLVCDSPAHELLEERLERVVSFLNERGYLAHWEPDTGLLHTYNCPYSGVAGEHRELCCMDLALMESLTGHSCQRMQTIAEEGHCCSYRVCAQNETETGTTIELADGVNV